MTIRRFNEWGRIITRPDAIETCNSDAAVAAIVTRYRQNRALVPHLHLTGGGLAAALGDSLPLSSNEVHELPADLLHVSYRTANGIQRTAVAANSVLMRHRWWLGQIIALTNGGYLGRWEIAPRAHPNDGVFDVVEVADDMSCRQRLIARRRLRVGTYLPHPSIRQRQGQADSWIFASPIRLYLDEAFIGLATQVHVTIEGDALKLVV